MPDPTPSQVDPGASTVAQDTPQSGVPRQTAVEPHTQPQPSPGATPAETEAAPDPSPEKGTPETDHDAAIKELESKLAEARNDARKKREQRREVMQEAGRYESLYTEAQQELAEVTRSSETLKAQYENEAKESKRLRAELDSYRTSLIDRFEEADRAHTQGVSLAQLPALFERLYGRGLMTPPPPSPTMTKPAGTQPAGTNETVFGKARLMNVFRS